MIRDSGNVNARESAVECAFKDEAVVAIYTTLVAVLKIYDEAVKIATGSIAAADTEGFASEWAKYSRSTKATIIDDAD
jgi:hypothetical protein